MISGAPWYVSNQTLHEDLKIPFIQDMIKSNVNKYKNMKIKSSRTFSPNLRRKNTPENLARRP
jgi:hypothetical protein